MKQLPVRSLIIAGFEYNSGTVTINNMPGVNQVNRLGEPSFLGFGAEEVTATVIVNGWHDRLCLLHEDFASVGIVFVDGVRSVEFNARPVAGRKFRKPQWEDPDRGQATRLELKHVTGIVFRYLEMSA